MNLPLNAQETEMARATFTKALVQVQAANYSRTTPVHRALVDEAASLLLSWQLAAIRHGVTLETLANVASLPTNALDCVIFVANR